MDMTSRGVTLCAGTPPCPSRSSSARVRYNTTATHARSVRQVSETSSSDCSDEYVKISPGATEENGPETRKHVLKQHTICCLKTSYTSTASPRPAVDGDRSPLPKPLQPRPLQEQNTREGPATRVTVPQRSCSPTATAHHPAWHKPRQSRAETWSCPNQRRNPISGALRMARAVCKAAR